MVITINDAQKCSIPTSVHKPQLEIPEVQEQELKDQEWKALLKAHDVTKKTTIIKTVTLVSKLL